MSFIVFSYLNPRFGDPRSLSLVLQQVAVIGALAVGQTLIILTAGIDLSVGAIAILAMMVSAKLAPTGHLRRPVAILVGMAVGAAARLPQRPARDPDRSCHRSSSRWARSRSSPRWPARTPRARACRRSTCPTCSTGPARRRDRPVPDHHRGGHGRAAVRRRRLRAEADRLGPARLRRRRRQRGRAAGRHPVDRVLLSVYTVAGLIYGITAWILIGRAGAASPNAMPTPTWRASRPS